MKGDTENTCIEQDRNNENGASNFGKELIGILETRVKLKS